MFSNIQMLRAFAAIMIVLHHSAPHYKAMNGIISSLLIKISTWSFTGVDIFFIISGFVIAHTTMFKERNVHNCIKFLKRRLSRIYLGYWPFFIAAYLVTLVYQPGNLDKIHLSESFLLINTDIFELLLSVSWSLSYELYFYIIFALFFAVRSEVVKVILPVLFVAIVFRLIFIHIDKDSPLSFFLSHFLVEFLSGTLLYIYREKLKKRWLIIVGIIVAIAAYSYGIHIEARNGPYRVYSFGLGSFAIVLTALTLESCGVYKANKFITAIGDSSYTLYLSHIVLLQLFYFTGIRTFLSSHGQPLIEIGFASLILFCLAFSHIFYRKVELPIYKLACKTIIKPAQSTQN